jgi:hypothetical protein
MHYTPMQRAVGNILLYGALLPTAKTLEVFGRWPMAMYELAAKAPQHSFGGYRPTANDVVACVGFKSGTHWVMQMALQISYRGRAEFEHIYDLVAWPDQPPNAPQFSIPLSDPRPLALSPTGLRIIKTHMKASEAWVNADAKYIAVVRDPKDVSVSAYHFLKSLIWGPMSPSAQHWVDTITSPGPAAPMPGQLSAWAAHAAGFWSMRNDPNMLFMTYEEMLGDARSSARRIAGLMGIELTADELELVMQKSSFAYMKSISYKFDWIKAVPWATSEGATIRQGRGGVSGELFSPEQQARIDAFCRAELERLGSDFPYDEFYGPAAKERRAED